jgi:hypothetical protein
MFVQLVQLERRLRLAMTHLVPTRNATQPCAPSISMWRSMFAQLALLARPELVGMTHLKPTRRAQPSCAPPTNEW